MFGALIILSVLSATAMSNKFPSPSISSIAQTLFEEIAALGKRLDELTQIKFQQKNEYCIQCGGIAGDMDKCEAFGAVIAAEFWQYANDTIDDIYWTFARLLAQTLLHVEGEFSLVIHQPQVRSWLRHLRQMSRIGQNYALDAVSKWQSVWIQLALPYQHRVDELHRQAMSGSADVAQRKYDALSETLFQHLKDIIAALKMDLASNSNKSIRQANILLQCVYQVEIADLKYFIS